MELTGYLQVAGQIDQVIQAGHATPSYLQIADQVIQAGHASPSYRGCLSVHRKKPAHTHTHVHTHMQAQKKQKLQGMLIGAQEKLAHTHTHTRAHKCKNRKKPQVLWPIICCLSKPCCIAAQLWHWEGLLGVVLPLCSVQSSLQPS